MAARTREPAAARKARQQEAHPTVDGVAVEPANGEAPAPEIPPPASETPNGVLVSKAPNPDGSLGFNIQVIGNTQITEIDFILEMGRRVFRQQIGLDEKK